METRNYRLPDGVCLNDRYQIQSFLGEGGFGITYDGYDVNAQCRVAIKELFPAELVERGGDGATVQAKLKKVVPRFDVEKKRFLDQARVLSQMDALPGIVRVLDYFEANGTAYQVMEYIEGITVLSYIEEQGAIQYEELQALFEPLLLSVQRLHEQGIIHRDISPNNLLIGLDNQLHLIDFGAAMVGYGSDTNQWVGRKRRNPFRVQTAVVLKKGFTPLEQYVSDGKLGPWTDVYGICATMYYMLSGRVPTEALARMQGEELTSLESMCEQLEPWQSQAVMQGMELATGRRYASVAQLQSAMTSQKRSEDLVTVYSSEQSMMLKKELAKMNRQKNIVSIICVGLLLVMMLVLAWLYFGKGQQDDQMPMPKEQNATSTELTTETTTKKTTKEQIVQEGTTEKEITTTQFKRALEAKEEQYEASTGKNDSVDYTTESMTTSESVTSKSVEATTRSFKVDQDMFEIEEEQQYDEFELGE